MARWGIGVAIGAALLLAAGCAAAEAPGDGGQKAAPGGGRRYEARPTVLEELKDLTVTLRPGYAAQHPRLEFSAGDKAALKARAEAHPGLWEAVVAFADEAKGDAPKPEEVRGGEAYQVRPNRAFAAALVGWLTDDAAYKRLAIDWTLAYCKEDLWGSGYQANVDMAATWYSYYFALVYDILCDDLSAGERKAIREGLAAHGRALYESQVPLAPDAEGPDVQKMIRWEQGHMYMPLVGLGAIAFALSGEVPEADEWTRLVYAKMRRTFWVHPEDGYHWEGPAYWEYAMHWVFRYGFLLERATGERLYDVPHFRFAALYGRHVGLPGSPQVFDISDCGGVNNWPGGDVGRRMDIRVSYSRYIFRGLARAFRDGVAQAMADEAARGQASNPDPAIEFLWYDPGVKAADLGGQPPYHHFTDNDVVFWRSGWSDDATCYAFRCGPVEGHSAVAKLARLKDWTMNHGHAHPDIGAFLMFARGKYLAVDTGYLCEKRAGHHNTLLVDGKGQLKDGSYWCYRGVPYERLDALRIEKLHLADAYGYVCGDMAAAYPDELGRLSMKRHLVMTKDWLLVIDDIEAEREHTYTWLVHTDGPIEAAGEGVWTSRAGAWQQQGEAWTWQPGPVALRVQSLWAGELPKGVQSGSARLPLEAKAEKTIVGGGGNPGQPKIQQRGYHLGLTTSKAAKKVRFITFLTPQVEGEEPLSARLGDWCETGMVVFFDRGLPSTNVGQALVQLTWTPERDHDKSGPVDLWMKDGKKGDGR